MTSRYESDSFFDSDGDLDQDSLPLKGEYDRGSTPPSKFIDNKISPKPDQTSDSQGKSSPVGVDSPVHSRPSSSGNFTADSDTMSRKRDSSKSYDEDSRSRSRSPSYRRTRTRTPSYSDSFDSEDSHQDSRNASPVRQKKTTRGRSMTTRNTSGTRYNSSSSKDSRSTYRSYGSSYTRSTRTVKKAPKKGGKTGRSLSVSTLQQSPRNANEVAKRMLSAKGHTINRLRSEVDDLKRKYDDAVRENRLMKQLQRRQEVALSKFEDKEEELPQLLRSHAAEVDNLRERLRRTQDKERDKDRKLKEQNEKLNKLNDELKRLQDIADDKRLLERDELQRKVDKLQDKLDEKNKKIHDVEKYLDNIKKNQKHDSNDWKMRERDYRSRVNYLEEENQRLQYQLKEKEKELDIKNIYSNRVIRAPARLNTSLSPPPARPLSHTKATSTDDLKHRKKPTPHPPTERKRASSAEENRKQTHVSPRTNPVKTDVKVKKPPKEEKKELSEHERILLDLDTGFKPSHLAGERKDDVLTQLDEDIKKREREEEELKRAEDRKRRESEENERRQRIEEEERKRTQRMAEEKKRKEEEEKRKREEEERKEKERKQKEEEEAARTKPSTFITSNSSAPKTPTFDSSSEDEDNIPFFGSKPQPHKSSPPKANGGFAVNSVRDLQKYSSNQRENSAERKHKEEEEFAAQRKKQKEEAEKLAEERRKKDLLLAKMREIDTNAKPASGKSHKEYKFTQPVENLHNGKPSHPDLLDSASSGGRKNPKDKDDDAFGGYAPSFGRRAAASEKPPAKKGGFFDSDDDNDDIFSKPKPAQNDKGNLMSNLFGDNKSNTPNKSRNSFEATVFSTSTKAKPVADSTALPWEKKATGDAANTGTLFTQNKPNGTLASKPKPSFDDFDDDIEEVIL